MFEIFVQSVIYYDVVNLTIRIMFPEFLFTFAY